MCEASWRAANSGRPQQMRRNTLPLCSELPRREILDNPCAALRNVIRCDRSAGPFYTLIGVVGNTTCNRVE
jgi:hypothetical protein